METAQHLLPIASSTVWEPNRTLALEGHCKRRLIMGWEQRLDRRFGAGAAKRVRMRMGPRCNDALVRDEGRWIPVYAQLRLAECIADEFYGGDLTRMESLAVEDVATVAGRTGSFALRRLGVRRAMAMGPRVHSRIYTVGRLLAEVGKHHAQLRFRGAELFENPTWRALQLFAIRSVFHIVGREVGEIHSRDALEGFDLALAW